MLGRTHAPGQVIGVAGGSLVGAGSSWAANAAVAKRGEEGERATAAILDPIARAAGGPTVLHDLNIPIPGFSANIDHLVVSGRTLHLIDAKSWSSGRYLTAPAFLGGKVYRDWQRFEPAEKKTMSMAVDALTRYLARGGVTAKFSTPLVVVWPTNTRKPTSLTFLRMNGATPVLASAFAKRAPKMYRQPADPHLVRLLMPLVNSVSTVPAASHFTNQDFNTADLTPVADRRFPDTNPYSQGSDF